MIHKIFLGLLCILTVVCSTNAQEINDWETWWEKSGFKETPKYKPTVDFCKRLALGSDMLSYSSFGLSPQGRALPMLVLDKDGLTEPGAIKNKGRLVVMIQACIHPGEAEGKDAMLVFLRDMLINGQHQQYLEDISFVFIPIFNVDGHERFSPYSRINQNGPVEGGWRTSAQNLNLNRDYVKADAPEMKAWLKLFQKWMPHFYIDCHTTDGADYQYTLTYSVSGYGAPALRNWLQTEYEPLISQFMDNVGHPIFPYVVFRRWHDPRSGLKGGIASPRYSNGYAIIRNRPGLLIETHMLKDYRTRVIATHEMLINTLEILALQRENLKSVIKQSEDFVSSQAFRERPCVLSYRVSEHDSVMVKFKGVDYSATKSKLTGGTWFKYNGKPQEFELPYYKTLIRDVTVRLPEAYLIPAEWHVVIERIKLHGIKYSILSKPQEINFETYEFSDVEWAKNPYEGRFVIKNLVASPIKRTKVFEKGSLIIKMDQPDAYLIAKMLEPTSKESFLYWGFFAAIFEQKEYVETYVMEKMAREMIKENKALAAEFEAWKKTFGDKHPSPYEQLMWFYRRTPYYDSEWNKYPVGRILSKEALLKLPLTN